jgi:hypothetical protein
VNEETGTRGSWAQASEPRVRVIDGSCARVVKTNTSAGGGVRECRMRADHRRRINRLRRPMQLTVYLERRRCTRPSWQTGSDRTGTVSLVAYETALSVKATYLGHRIGRHQPVRMGLNALKEDEHRLELTGRHRRPALKRESLLVSALGEGRRAGQVRLDVRGDIDPSRVVDVELGGRERGQIPIVAGRKAVGSATLVSSGRK